jgi:cobyrinic acid a,c-diamide synthase
MAQGIIIAGTHSGVGKTTITAGLIAALRRRGLTVQPFKIGPDYIDPTYHTLSAGRRCRNLDTWLMPRDRIVPLVMSSTRAADFAVIEGVMGLFDGLGYEEDVGSTAEIAKLLDLPVVLVIDAAKTARSAAAIVVGYDRFDPDLCLAGVIINRVASEQHGRGVARAIAKASTAPVLGWIPRDAHLQIAERHLGLVPTVEPGRWSDFLAAAERAVAERLDIDLLCRLAAPIQTGNRDAPEVHGTRLAGQKPIVAVACDEAFHFTYEENVELLRQAGGAIVFFSPLHDHAIPSEASGIILSGGFPEMYAARLAANFGMIESIRDAHARQTPIYAECGGLMYLTEAIVDQEGHSHEMVGLLPGHSVMSDRLTLGYRRGRAVSGSWLFDAGEEVHGHEFHYSRWENRPAGMPAAYLVQSATGEGETWPEGVCIDNIWASYLHLHFWGKPELAERFVAACHRVRAGAEAGVS